MEGRGASKTVSCSFHKTARVVQLVEGMKVFERRKFQHILHRFVLFPVLHDWELYNLINCCLIESMQVKIC